MPDRFAFLSAMEKEAEEFLQSMNDRRGSSSNNRQAGQRRRRLREALYQSSSTTTGNMTFTSDPESFKQAAIESIVQEANIEDSVGQMLERYGSPAGGELVDDTEYDEEVDEDETIEGYTLYPKKAKIFGDKDGFGDWMQSIYLSSRPMLDKQINYNYWKVKDGAIHFGGKRSPEAKARALKWVSYKLRQRISAKGITPNSVTFSSSTTILNYDAGQHSLHGRDV